MKGHVLVIVFLFIVLPLTFMGILMAGITWASFSLKWRASFAIRGGILFAWVGVLVALIKSLQAISESTSSTAAIGYLYLAPLAAIAGILGFLIGWASLTAVKAIYAVLRCKTAELSKLSILCASAILTLTFIGVFPIIRRYIQLRRVHVVSSKSFENSVGMEMVYLSTGYYVSKYETRQAEFIQVMDNNPSTNLSPDHPVEHVSISEALGFCEKLTQREKESGTLPPGFRYELPTLQQWEEFVADTKKVANSVVDLPVTLPVGSGDVNRLEIYDLGGNVAEFLRGKGGLDRGPAMVGRTFLNEPGTNIKNVGAFSSYTDKSLHVGFRCVLEHLNSEAVEKVPSQTVKK